jgi:hypothetical protein
MEARLDSRGLPADDPGCVQAIEEGIGWLCRAQDCSASRDGGVARHYSLIEGWAPSYPETTGYIIPTLIEFSRTSGDPDSESRARRMLDWLASIQFPEGGFQGGVIGARVVVPVVFNTGQILLGLASGCREFGAYRDAMCLAADWLVKNQDSDGCWRRYSSPFAAAGEKTYDTHVAWGLLEAGRLEPSRPYAEAALSNVRWALRWQKENGWFEKCCLTDPLRPLTHTLGYALRGVIEAHRFSGDKVLLQAACRTADGLLSAVDSEGFLPGRLDSQWNAAVKWSCLTGSVQVASCWLILYRETAKTRYREAAFAVNRYVRRTMRTQGASEIRGAIKGSFPIQGQYNPYVYLNWACKFFVDANRLESAIRSGD